MNSVERLLELIKTMDYEKVVNVIKSLSERETKELLKVLEEYNATQEKMNRYELILAVVDEYMSNLLDNPEVVRDALVSYFDGFDNETLANTLKGFKDGL